MIVLAKNAEDKLLEDMHAAPQSFAGFLCFHLRLGLLEIPKKELFETVFRVLEEIPNSYTAQVYICHDKDMLILMRGFMQRQFMSFLHKLARELAQPVVLELFTVFNMEQDITRIMEICRDKIDIRNEQDQRAEENLKKQHTQNLAQTALADINPEQIRTIAARRRTCDDIIIMITDDDQLSRTLAGNVLEKDFSVIYAKNGKEALSNYVHHAPDVLFLDIGLPDINGHDVLELIFQMDESAYIIMFSGRTDKENIIRALESGAQGFVGKPFTRDKLFQYVEKSPFVQEKRGRPHPPAHHRSQT